jgi:hypothetical protein
LEISSSDRNNLKAKCFAINFLKSSLPLNGYSCALQEIGTYRIALFVKDSTHLQPGQSEVRFSSLPYVVSFLNLLSSSLFVLAFRICFASLLIFVFTIRFPQNPLTSLETGT